MDGEPKLRFPAPARPLGAPEVHRDLFPGLKEIVVRHQSEPQRIVDSRIAWIIDRIGAANHSLIVILSGYLAQ